MNLKKTSIVNAFFYNIKLFFPIYISKEAAKMVPSYYETKLHHLKIVGYSGLNNGYWCKKSFQHAEPATGPKNWSQEVSLSQIHQGLTDLYWAKETALIKVLTFLQTLCPLQHMANLGVQGHHGFTDNGWFITSTDINLSTPAIITPTRSRGDLLSTIIQSCILLSVWKVFLYAAWWHSNYSYKCNQCYSL